MIDFDSVSVWWSARDGDSDCSSSNEHFLLRSFLDTFGTYEPLSLLDCNLFNFFRRSFLVGLLGFFFICIVYVKLFFGSTV